MKQSAIFLAGVAAAAVGYAAFARPRHLRYGTTWRERGRIWAGDEFNQEPGGSSKTRVPAGSDLQIICGVGASSDGPERIDEPVMELSPSPR